MLSISSRGSAAEAVSYYAHLKDERGRQDEYYACEGDGTWFGVGAEALGLSDEVSAKMFAHAAAGRSPAGDLVQGAGEKHRAGWDLTFSAPKSVSVLWGVADAERRAQIQAAHGQAVERALQHIEQEFTLARRGKGGVEREQAKLLWSVFQHGTSREQDPQLHSHAFLHNLAQRADGGWGGLDPRQIFQWKMALGATYRAGLASSMRELGYKIEADGDSFRVSGVPHEVCRQFSKRREQIEAALAKAGQTSAKASEVAALGTRQAKSKDLNPDELHAHWQTEATEMGFHSDQALAAEVEAEDPGPMPSPDELLRRSTAHDAVIEARDVWRAVAIECQHRGLGIDAIKQHVELVMQSSEIMRLVHTGTEAVRFTTRELYRQEREIIAVAQERATEDHHSIPAAMVDRALEQFSTEKGFALSDEQQAAVRHVTERAGAVQVIVGDAGTGKSTATLAARMAWESAGQRVSGCAISGKAAAGLQEGSGIESRTIASLLLALEPSTDPDTSEVRPPRETLTANDVIVVDEAGMVDSRTMHRLMEHVNAARARIVLVGDHKQLQSVGAGGVFRHLAEHDSARISEIRRQKSEWARDAVQEFSRGDAAAAVSKFVDRGLVHIADDQRSAITQAVDRWAAHAAEVGAPESLLMASTNAEVALLNQAARARMQAEHRLVNEIEVQTHDRQGRPTGKLAVAEGDRLLAKKNDRATSLKNGDLMTVERIEYTSSGVQIIARLDRTAERVTIDPAEYSQIRHGYAVTTHAAQGATVDRAVALAGGSMTSRESTYVQMSRMRETAEIIATRQQLRDAAEQVGPTPKMLELAETVATEQAIDLPPECSDSFAACRAWLDQHSHQNLGAPEEKGDRLAELKDLVSAMSESREKKTTLDYQAAEEHTVAEQQAEAAKHTPEPAQPEHHQVHEMTMEIE